MCQLVHDKISKQFCAFFYALKKKRENNNSSKFTVDTLT